MLRVDARELCGARLNVGRIFGAPLAKGSQRLSQSSPKRECPNHVVSDYFCHYEKLTRIKLDFRRVGRSNRNAY